jgi:ribosomal protein S18 acetylase RimI-like enzyme
MDRAVITLDRAFATDSLFGWIFPDPVQRSQSLRAMNRVLVQYGLRYGRVTESNNGMAVAIWILPGRTITAIGMIRCGMVGTAFRIGLRRLAKFVCANEVMGQFRKKYAHEPHWRLLIIGVDPDLQGRGVGSALVKEGLARADDTNCPCYVETNEKRNMAFYERLGFVVVGTAPLGKGAPPGWAMRREPRPSSQRTAHARMSP